MFNGFRPRHHPTFFVWFPSWQGTLFLWFLSLVVLWFLSWRGFLFLVLWFPLFQQHAKAEARRGWDATDPPQIHDRAGDAWARSDSGIVTRSPAAKDPDLTSGLRGFNPGRARFQGNCVCLFFACLLLACCLLVACVLFVFCSFSSRGAKLGSRAERHRYVSCFRYASVTFPLCFRYVSVVRLPVAPARGKC